jgi:tetraacyldisaccharide 4'-kinase
VSRGYGRKKTTAQNTLPNTLQNTPLAASPIEVSANSLPANVGDECLLIHLQTQAPVFVSTQRVLAAQALLQAHPGVQVILSDDGLQHLALRRDLELCVFDDRGVGNGWLLPAGMLREPWPRQPMVVQGTVPVQWVVHTGSQPAFAGYRVQRQLAHHAVRRNGDTVTWAALREQAPQCQYCALAGIAQPQAFFDQLRDKGIMLDQALALPDHCDFNSIKLLPFKREKAKNLVIFCTEKDAAKLWSFWPEALAVPLEVTVADDLLNAITDFVKAKTKST